MPTTDQTKPFKSYDEQIALLRERGLIITDDVYARDVLKRMNYYRFSAYSLTLRENDRFFPEVTLQDMVALYDFDQEFRSIISSMVQSLKLWPERTSPTIMLGSMAPLAT